MTQTALLCGCGKASGPRGFCTKCARRSRLNVEKFGGLREAALRRDGYQCQTCGEVDPAQLLVHHRRPGWNRLPALITLCRACHVRVHHTDRPAFAFRRLGLLYRLWREANRRLPEQNVLAIAETPPGVQPDLFPEA